MTTALRTILEPRRERIVQLVWHGERTAGDIARQFDVTFGAVSQHLRVLLEAGVVEQRRDGRKRWYRANKRALGPLAEALEAMWADRLGELKRVAEAEELGRAPSPRRDPSSSRRKRKAT